MRYATSVGEWSDAPDEVDFGAYAYVAENTNAGDSESVATVFGKLVDELKYAQRPGGTGLGQSGKSQDDIVEALWQIADNSAASVQTLDQLVHTDGVPDFVKTSAQETLVEKTDLRTDTEKSAERAESQEKDALKALADLVQKADPDVLAELVGRPKKRDRDKVVTEDLLNQALDRAFKNAATDKRFFEVIEKMSENFKDTTEGVLERIFDEVEKDYERVKGGDPSALGASDIDDLKKVMTQVANNTSVSVETLNKMSKHEAAADKKLHSAITKMLSKKVGQSQQRKQRQQQQRNNQQQGGGGTT